MPPKILGLCGPIGCGKTTLANELAARHQYAPVSFAEPLKRMLGALLVYQGTPCVSEHLRGNRKGLQLFGLGDKDARYAMQTLGTEWGRGLIHPDVWIRSWTHHIEHIQPKLVVTDDVRFENEVAAIHELGGTLIRIHRPGVDYDMTHESEISSSLLQADDIILNIGTAQDLVYCLPPGFVNFPRPTPSQPSINAEELGL